jgi:hypothetical protein
MIDDPSPDTTLIVPDTPAPPVPEPAPAPRRRRAGWVAVSVVLAVAAGIGGYLAFAPGPDTPPDQVVAGFARAYTALERDPTPATLAALDAYLCPHDQKAAQPVYGPMVAAKQPGEPGTVVTASRPHVIGDTATFTVTIDDDQGSAIAVRGHLTDTNGTWQVCGTM